MKRILRLTLLAVFMLSGLSTFADVAYEPPETAFYTAHQKECSRVERLYYTNGAEGYIALCKSPDGQILQYIANAEKVEVFCSYGDWGMITHLNGKELDVPGWAELGTLYLIYDEQAFREEHQAELYPYTGILPLQEGAGCIYIYDYPGAADYWVYPNTDDSGFDAVFSDGYNDPQGRIWARVPYYRGIRSQWVCISDPHSEIPAFGGDPSLQAFEQAAAEGDAIKAEDSPLIEAAEPPRQVPLDPMIPAAVGLTALAVIAAVVLLAVCYKKKGNGK